MPIDDHTKAFLDKANINPSAPPGSVPIDVFREALYALRPLGWDREEVAEVRELVVSAPGGIDVPVRLYRPETDGSPPLIVCVHGGSFVRQTVDMQDEYYRALANRSRCVLAAVDFRLAPESQFPSQLEEIYAASRWLQAAAAELGCDPDRFGILGESSGGNLVAATTLLARDRGEVRFAHQVLVIPWLAMRWDSPSWKEFGADYLLQRPQLEWGLSQYAPGAGLDNPLVSPLFADDHSGLPPALIVTAQYDPLRDDGEQYAEALQSAGVPVEHWRVPGLIHHAMMIPKAIPLGAEFIDQLAKKVNATFAGPYV